MTNLEDFVVREPYSPTEEESRAIAELEANGLSAKDWDSKKNGITSFKKNLRRHMYYQQNCRCAYCRIELPIGCSFLQREHIVPKNPHPKWMFLPRNLCFSCDYCNALKNDEEILKNPNAEDFPSESDAFLIINPFIDKYSEHIELQDGIIYIGKTDKGRFTIKTCGLFRTDLLLERAKIKMHNDDPDSVKSKCLSLLSRNGLSEEEFNNTISDLQNIVDMFKRKNKFY